MNNSEQNTEQNETEIQGEIIHEAPEAGSHTEAPSEAVANAEEVTPSVTPDEAAILKDRLLRLQADFDNFRKRSARERADWQVFALEQFVQDLLPVVDHYELGLETAKKEQTSAPVLEGLKLVYDQLLGVLKKNGVTQVKAEPGTPFDPHKQEAISHIPSEEHPADVIIAETRRGYLIGEKMIRPLQVVVSSGAAQTAEG